MRKFIDLKCSAGFVQKLRKPTCATVLAAVLILTGMSHAMRVAAAESAAQTERAFKVPVKLMHAYETDRESMGNPAMEQEALVQEGPDGVRIQLDFKALDFMNMHGHLLKMYSWDAEAKAKLDATCHEAKVLEQSEDVGLDGQKAQFPSKVEIQRKVARESEIYVRVRVDAMDAISGGDGAGEQNARLVLDYSGAPEASEDLPKAQSGSGQSNTLAAPDSETADENPEQSANAEPAAGVDLSALEPGKYLVPLDLWHMHEDRPSMGNAALNHEALLTIGDQGAELEFTGHPLAVSGITASLISFQYPDKNGEMQFADAVEKELPDNKPSKFRFPLHSGTEYMPCMVDPNVEAMGNKPVKARLRFYWDKLSKVADDYVLVGDKNVQYGDVYTPAVDQTDEQTGIRLVAEERVLADGARLQVKTIKDGEFYEQAKKYFDRNAYQFVLYDLQVVGEDDEILQPIREVELYLPTEQKDSALYLIQPNGTPNEVRGSFESGQFKARVKHFGYYALRGEALKAGVPILPIIIVVGALILVLLIVLILKGGKKTAGTAAIIALLLILNNVQPTSFIRANEPSESAQASNTKIPELKRGAYEVQIYGSYLNPDTGVTEDGGTQNAEIGEGMVDGVVTPSNPAGGIDSVFGKPKPGEEHYADALVERRIDGKYFATVRLYLMNFIRFSDQDGPFIKVRQPDGSYRQEQYDITQSLSEENGVNYHDFRVEIPDPNFQLSVEMFVMPMSRPVKYFIATSGKYTAGHGEFQDYFVQEDEAFLKAQQQQRVIWIAIACFAVVLIALLVVLLIRRKRGGKQNA